MPTSEEVDWELVSNIKASQRKQQILDLLTNGPELTGDIADELGVSTLWARRQLKWLEDRGLVHNLTADKPNYFLWDLTEKGEDLLDYL